MNISLQQPPDLDIDKILHGPKSPMRPNHKLERRIVWNLIKHLEASGFRVWQTFDGDSLEHPTDAKAAMELVFNLDEVSLRFVHQNTTTPSKLPTSLDEADDIDWHGVLINLGNGEEIISDWNYDKGDSDGFNAAMEAFKVESCF